MEKTRFEEVVKKTIKENNKRKDRIIPLRVDLIDICEGNLNAGIMLCQLIYWCQRGDARNKGWIYKSATEWFEETRLTDHRVKNGSNLLKKLGFVMTKNRVAVGHNTRWFFLNSKKILSELENLYAKRRKEAADNQSRVLDLKTNDKDQVSNGLDQVSSTVDVTSNYTESNTAYPESSSESSPEDPGQLSDSQNDEVPIPSLESGRNSARILMSPLLEEDNSRVLSVDNWSSDKDNIQVNLAGETDLQREYLHIYSLVEFPDEDYKNRFIDLENKNPKLLEMARQDIRSMQRWMEHAIDWLEQKDAMQKDGHLGIYDPNPVGTRKELKEIWNNLN